MAFHFTKSKGKGKRKDRTIPANTENKGAGAELLGLAVLVAFGVIAVLLIS